MKNRDPVMYMGRYPIVVHWDEKEMGEVACSMEELTVSDIPLFFVAGECAVDVISISDC
jgi:hypothetical protein